jgi:hypothetical protein
MDQVEGPAGGECVAHHADVRIELAAQFLDKARDLSGMDIRHQVHIQGCAVNAMNAAGHRAADQIGNRATAQRLDQSMQRLPEVAHAPALSGSHP